MTLSSLQWALPKRLLLGFPNNQEGLGIEDESQDNSWNNMPEKRLHSYLNRLVCLIVYLILVLARIIYCMGSEKAHE